MFRIIVGGSNKPIFMMAKDLKDCKISARLVFGKDIIKVEEVKPEPKNQRVCSVCGAKFIPYVNIQRRCSNCIQTSRTKMPTDKRCLYCHKDITDLGSYEKFCDDICGRRYYDLRNRIVVTFDPSELNEEMAKLKEFGKDYKLGEYEE